jgi:hypothetical protein
MQKRLGVSTAPAFESRSRMVPFGEAHPGMYRERGVIDVGVDLS